MTALGLEYTSVDDTDVTQDVSAVPDDPVLVVQSSSTVGGTTIGVVARKLPDGRWVTCIAMSTFNQGGIDCDWRAPRPSPRTVIRA